MALAARRKTTPRRRTTVLPPDRESGVRLRDVASPPRAREREARLRAVAAAAHGAALGFGVCARREPARARADALAELADELRAIAIATAAEVPGGVRPPSTSERLRWEWLASTAALLDGGAARRLVADAGRALADAEQAASRLADDEDEEAAAIVERIRLAAVTGRTLAQLDDPERGTSFIALCTSP